MSSSHWIKLFKHNSDPGDQWLGKISLADDKSARWKFELVASVASISSMYKGITAFDDRKTITGLIDLQRECTLIFPSVTGGNPGSLGINYVAMREIIKGQFNALLENTAVEDLDEPLFDTLSINSDSFVSWSGAPSPHTTDPAEGLIRNIHNLSFEVEDLGTVEVQSAVYTSLKTWSNNSESSSTFTIIFRERQSLRQIMNWATGLEMLFQFLIGKSTRWNSFWGTGKKDSDEIDNYKLTFGNTPHKTDERPHPGACRHRNGLGGVSINSVLENYAQHRERIAPLIDSLSYARHRATNLQEKFSIIMPLLEKYLKGRFSEGEEISYSSHRRAFFDWVESSNNAEIIEFSKKHMKEVDTKSPSLKTLLSRSAAMLSNHGFYFSEALLARIPKRRVELFHSRLQINETADANKFKLEVMAIIAMLTLHVMLELGIELTELNRTSMWSDEINPFFKTAPAS